MTTATAHKSYSPRETPQRGDQVIVVNRLDVPEVRIVSSTTKSGQFSFEGTNAKRRYKMTTHDHAMDMVSRDGVRVYPYSDARLCLVQIECDARNDEKRAKREAAEAKAAAREEERRKQIEHIRSLVPELSVQYLPDGTRMFQRTFASRLRSAPTDDNPNAVMDRGWVLAIVLVKTIMERDWNSDVCAQVQRFEVNVNYLSDGRSSFSGGGHGRHETEDAAVYEGLRYCYYESW